MGVYLILPFPLWAIFPTHFLHFLSSIELLIYFWIFFLYGNPQQKVGKVPEDFLSEGQKTTGGGETVYSSLFLNNQCEAGWQSYVCV